MPQFKRVLFFILVICLLVSCRKATTANWDVDLIIPVTTSNLNISNFIGDTLINADSTGLFHFIFNRELDAITLDSLLQLPDTIIPKDFTWAYPDYTLTPGQIIPNTLPSETKFNLPNGIQLKRIEIRNSILNVNFSNTINQPIDVIIDFPGITKAGVDFHVKETIPTGNNSVVRNYNLAGYTMDMTGLNGLIDNTIVQNFTVMVNPNATDVAVKYGQGLFMQIGYTNVQPQLIEGYFGEQTIERSDTTKIKLLKNFTADNFMLSDAKVNFSILNEIGADFSGGVSQLGSYNSANRKNVILNNNQLQSININAAKRISSTVMASTLAVSFNTLNSNVTDFISNLPDKLCYSAKVSINPKGDLTKNFGQFAYYNTGIRFMADIDIPVRFRANNFKLETLSKVDFSNVAQLDDFNYGNFVITAANSFPFAAQLQAYLLNSNQQVIDSLLIPGTNTIAYGNVNNQNIVVSEQVSTINVPFDKAKIAHLKVTKYIQLKSKFIFPPSPPEISILEKYKLNIGIVAELNYNAKISR